MASSKAVHQPYHKDPDWQLQAGCLHSIWVPQLVCGLQSGELVHVGPVCPLASVNLYDNVAP